MPNQPKAGHVAVTIRLAPELAARLDAAVASFRAEHPGARYDRTDAIRGALLATLPPLEEPAPAKPAAKRKPRG